MLLKTTAQCGEHVFLFAHAFFGHSNRDAMVAGVRFHPLLVIVRARAQNLLAHHRDSQNLAEEMHHLLGARQAAQIAQIAIDDNTVQAMVYKNQQAAKQL